MANKQKKASEVYKDIFDEIFNNIPKDATKVTKDLKQDETIDDKSAELRAREKAYTRLTEDFEFNYKETHKQKRDLKKCFFGIVMSLFVIIICGSMFAIIYSLFLEGEQIEVVLGATTSILGSVIVIPIFIAKYLFPTGEDRDMTSMISRMQNYDIGIRRIENRNKDIAEKPSNETEKDDS